MLDGLSYAVSRQELLGSYVIDINAMFFGMPFALFPALAERYGGTAVVGLLWAAPGGRRADRRCSTSGWATRVHHNGRAIVLGGRGVGRRRSSASGWPTSLWLALVLLALAGRGGRRSRGIFRGALWNETIPDRMRGRLAGVEMISWSSGPLLGNARAGAAAGCSGLRASVVIGGVLCRRRLGRRSRRCCRASGTTTRGRVSGQLRGGRVDHGEALAEGEAQVAAPGAPARR